MADTTGKIPAEKRNAGEVSWYPFESLRREVDRLFEDFDGGLWRMPGRSLWDFTLPRFEGSSSQPAVDIAEKDGAYEISAELPGLDEKDVEVTVANGGVTISGEKKVEKEEKKKDYYLSERRYGSFKRFFTVPEGVDTDKIAASFKNGVLTITLPKSPQAQQQQKKIAVKAE